ncbi:MAG TPA: thiamine phosphate synthase [Pyrinomonadaceae bacterium]|nr:thiamine phosphate synthase [Pyrinomonadaceae bacterium]
MRRSFRLPQVYPITDVQISRLSHAVQVALFVEAGATLVQLREKRASAAEFYEAAKAALTVATERGVQLIVNDRVDIVLAIAATGVHLGQDDLPPEAARRLLGDEAVIGYSIHSVSQALEASGLPIDYLAIGPIFSTSTKENPDPVVGLEGLRTVRDAIGRLPLVAIGGITPANAGDVIRAGADSVAMISALWDEGSVVSSAFTLPFPQP